MGQVATDDTRFRVEFIEQVIREKRSTLAASEAKRGIGVDAAYYQIVDCLTVDCGTVTCPGVVKGVRFEHLTIPIPMAFRGAISYLGTLDGSTVLSRRSLTAFNNLPLPRRGPAEAVYVVIGNMVLMKNGPKAGTRLRAMLIQQDPLANTCKLTTENDPYPIPDGVTHDLTVLCLKQMMSILGIRPDPLNNAVDDSVPGQTRN